MAASGTEVSAARRAPGIRLQLLLLFGLLLATGAIVIALDEYRQRAEIAALTHLHDDALAGLRATKAVSDAYGLDVVDTAFRVRNYLLGWDQGVAVLDRAQTSIATAWARLEHSSMPPEQRALLDEIARARGDADRASARLRTILQAQDIHALGRFADTELYPAIDPVTSRLNFLADLKMQEAEQLLAAQAAAARRLSWWRSGLSLFAFAVVVLVGQRILRNIYRGIEQLVRMAQAMSTQDYRPSDEALPHGELGTVAQAFLAMRAQLRRFGDRLRDSETRALEASRSKSEFLAAMSHEIRTPLIGVTGMLELLEHTRLDAEQRRCVEVVRQSSESLQRILGDILDFSKIEAGRLELAPEPVDLRRLVEGGVQHYLGAASAKGLRLSVRIDAALAPAHRADPLRLRQILANFLSNALKFTGQGGIEVELRRLAALDGAERIALSVRDSGIGVSEAQRERLFAPFTQAEGGTARRYGGTGLGLAICRSLATLMGGEIGLDGRLGEGTTARLVVDLPLCDPALLPIATASASYPTRPLPSVEAAERERSLVLMVDDHPTNREVVMRQLARAGYACETADDGEEGLRRWRSGRFALVLADVHMPRMDGYQLAAAIRAEERRSGRARTPIIALTANVTQGEPERCLAAGMDDFLAKPVAIAALAARLRQWLPHVPFPEAAAAAVAPATASTNAAPVDAEALLAIAGDDRTLAHNLLHDFIATCERDLAALNRALADADVDAAAREAHRIKGAARLVGAQALAGAAEAIERAARGEGVPAARRLAQDAYAALDALRAWSAASA